MSEDKKEKKSLADYFFRKDPNRKSILYAELKLPFSTPKITVSVSNFTGVLPTNILYEKTLFYENLEIIVKKKQPLIEGLETMKSFSFTSLDPFRFGSISSSAIVNTFTAIIINILWLFYVPLIFLFSGRTSGYFKERCIHLNYWSKILSEHIGRGLSLDEAMQKCRGSFSKFEVNLIRSAIRSGNLELALGELRKYFKLQQQKSKILYSQIAYPILLLFIGGFITSFILIKIIPKFVDIFTQLGAELPSMTMTLIHISDLLMHKFLYIFFGIIIIILLIRNIGFLRSMKYYIPYISEISRLSFLRKILLITGIQLKGGVPIDEVIITLKDTTTDPWTYAKINKIESKIKRGIPFCEAVKTSGISTSSFHSGMMLLTESDNLPEHLIDLARDMNDYLNISSGRLSRLIEPALHFIIAMIIAYVIIAMYLPLIIGIPRLMVNQIINL